MCKFVYILIVSAFLLNPAYACDTPEKAVTAYLKYDFDGERLGNDVSVHIDKLAANPYEPAWDVITLVTKYAVQSITKNKKSAIAKVKFFQSWETARKFKPASVKDEIIEIPLEKIKGCWKIGPPFYQPHVSPMIALKHFEQLLENAKNASVDNSYMDYTNSVVDSIRQYIDLTKSK